MNATRTPGEPGGALVTRRQAPRAADPAEAGSGASDEVAPGQYWRPRKSLRETHTTRRSHPEMAKSTVLLVTHIEYADGAMHSVHLAAHPAWDKDCTSHLHIDDFLDEWEHAWDADRVREAEMSALAFQMQATQEAMLAGPPAAEAEALLQHEPAQNEGGTGQELATTEGLQAMVARAGALQAQAHAQAQWIKKHTETLGTQGQTLARYHNERGEAMLARAKNQLEGVDKVFALVKNLRIYTGEDVGVDLIRDGEPAAAEAPISVYQDVLALDEETGALIDQGGLDHRDMDELAKLLGNEALRDRLIPAQRGLVLCRFRRTEKTFFRAADNASLSEALGAAIANSEANEQAQALHLLYRDGCRFYLISHKDLFVGMSQLMPSAAEQNEQFIRTCWTSTGRGERITPDDLDYAKAQRQQLGTLNAYARVLVLLWGLADRTALFSSTCIPRYANWLEPSFQTAHLNLVSHDTMLGEEREEFAAFRCRHNAYLASGSQVAVHVPQLLNDETAPGCYGPSYYDRYSRRERRNQVYRYKGPRVVIDRVRMAHGKPYIEIAAHYDGYSAVQRETITTKLWLSDLQQILVLDRLHGPDLDYYLSSRRQRREYAEYLELFRAAREHVTARDREEAALRSALAHAVVEARIAHAPDALNARITDAIASVRTSSRGAFADTPATRKKALNALHAMLTSGKARIDAAANLARSLGRQPRRLAHAGSGAWKLYMDSIDSDRDPRLAHHPWVMSVEIAFDTLGARPLGELEPVLLRAVAGEQAIHEWPALSPPSSSPEVNWQQLQRALSRVRETDDALPDKLSIARASYEIAWEGMRKSKQHVQRPRCGFAIGTVLTHKIMSANPHQRRSENNALKTCVNGAHILVCVGDALSMAFHWGDSALKERCRQAVRRMYARVEPNLERLESGAPDLDLMLAPLPMFASATAARALFVSRDWQYLPDRYTWGRPASLVAAKVEKDGTRGCLQLTSLNRIGTLVQPELVEHCEAPAW